MLAGIGRINSLMSIDGADRIELAEVVVGKGGKWLGVVGKGQFEKGNLCVVFMQDAVVPKLPELAFMERHNYRVKMARFKGVPSECVIMPVSLLPDGEYTIGDDVAGVLGVTKFDKPLDPKLGGNPKGNFPWFIPKTDELNFQTAQQLVEALKGKPYYITVKMDGSSCTAWRDADGLHVCSRNLEISESEGNAYWCVANKYNLKEMLPIGYAVQFEVYGEGIQKNPLGITGLDGALFNVYDTERREYCDFEKVVEFGSIIPMVPIVETGPCFNYTDDELRFKAEGAYPNGKQREGIVIRPLVEEKGKGQRLSFKVINLKYKD